MSMQEIIQIEIDKDLKSVAEAILQESGMDAATAVTIFYEQVVEKGGLPFEKVLSGSANQADRIAALAKKLPHVTEIGDNRAFEDWLNEGQNIF